MRVLGHAARAPSPVVNVVANYIGKFWGIASVYIFVPIYISLLGIGAYGLIAFYSVALAIMFIADAGLSSTFGREAAREPDFGKLLNLLSGIERLIFGIVGFFAAIALYSADWIAAQWLHTNGTLQPSIASDCVRLMAFAVVPQIAMSVYFGGLMGLQRQVRANFITVIFSFVRSGLVVAPIYFWPDPRVFFVWQAITSWIFVIVLRTSLRRALGARGPWDGKFSMELLRPLIGYAAGMFAMSFIAGLNSQLDRLVVSKLRPLEEFSYYSLAATLAQIPTILTMPIAMALLPRLTKLQEEKSVVLLREIYEFNTFLIATCGAASAFALYFFAPDVLAIWLHGDSTPGVVISVVRLLSIGGLFLSLQLTPFQLSLANGHNKTNVRLGVVVLFVTIPMQIFLTMHFGLRGAAIPWLVLNMFAFFFLGIILNQRFNQGHTRKWFLIFTLIPVLSSGFALAGARFVATSLHLSPVYSCALAAFICATVLATALSSWPVLKRATQHV